MLDPCEAPATWPASLEITVEKKKHDKVATRDQEWPFAQMAGFSEGSRSFIFLATVAFRPEAAFERQNLNVCS